ncbi:MAG: hypothetical protein AAFR23_10330, partial [Pseudomonadota bacterium]
DTHRIRMQLRNIFDAQLSVASDAFDELETLILPELVRLLVSQAPQPNAEDYRLPSSQLVAPASLVPLSNPVSLDLGDPWWRRWWSGLMDKETQRQRLEALVQADFYPIANALEQAAFRYLADRQAQVVKNATTVFVTLAEQLQRHSDTQLAEANRLMMLQEAEKSASQIGGAHAKRRSDLAERLEKTNRTHQSLNQLAEVWRKHLQSNETPLGG